MAEHRHTEGALWIGNAVLLPMIGNLHGCICLPCINASSITIYFMGVNIQNASFITVHVSHVILHMLSHFNEIFGASAFTCTLSLMLIIQVTYIDVFEGSVPPDLRPDSGTPEACPKQASPIFVVEMSMQ